MKFGSHPLNLGLRFILEMTALFAFGWWSWTQHDGWVAVFLTTGLPVLVAIVWGVFAVPGDPSRSGKTVIKTPGWVRLFLEFAIFGFASWAFYNCGYPIISLVFILAVALHYILSFDRIKWLLSH